MNGLIKEWQSSIKVAKSNGNHFLVFNTQRVKGDIYLEFKEYREATLAYKELKKYCEETHHYKDKIVCYRMLGVIHHFQEEFVVACNYFRKALELAWDQQHEEEEVKAYDNLALCFFYMGDLQKARYYNDRMQRGKIEGQGSVLKSVTKNIISAKRNEDKYWYYIHPEYQSQQKKGLPQFDFGLSRDYKLLPHYSEKDSDDMNEEENKR